MENASYFESSYVRFINNQLITKHEMNHTLPCGICGKEGVGSREFSEYGYIVENNGSVLSKSTVYEVVDKQVVVKPKAFIVCSEECRRQHIFNHYDWYYCDLIRGCGLAPKFLKDMITLDKYTNESNAAKMKGIKERLDGPKGFYLQGIPGSGKSVIAAGLLLEYRRRGMSVKFCSFSQLYHALSSNYMVKENLDALIYRKDGSPWGSVIIDDCTTSFPGALGKERMMVLFDEWYNNGTKVVMTSNETAEAFGNAIAERVLSRMKEMMTTVTLPDVDYRVEQPTEPEVFEAI